MHDDGKASIYSLGSFGTMWKGARSRDWASVLTLFTLTPPPTRMFCPSPKMNCSRGLKRTKVKLKQWPHDWALVSARMKLNCSLPWLNLNTESAVQLSKENTTAAAQHEYCLVRQTLKHRVYSGILGIMRDELCHCVSFLRFLSISKIRTINKLPRYAVFVPRGNPVQAHVRLQKH